MDKSLKNFSMWSFIVISLLITILLGLNYAYRYFSKAAYEFVLLNLIFVTILMTIIYLITALTVFYIYSRGSINSALIWAVKIGLVVVVPFITMLYGVLKLDKDIIRRFYIDINNILTQSGKSKYRSEDILLILPHCLQHSDCKYKITNTISNCKKCGRCCVGDILILKEEKGVNVAVVTGGTAARNLISKSKPKLILSVACERDLVSGIVDVRKIPVLAVVNKRPNGPCNNTTVDMKGLTEKLEKVMEK